MEKDFLMNTFMIIKQVEYKEYIIVKAVHQILKIRNRKYKHLDGFNISTITQIKISN